MQNSNILNRINIGAIVLYITYISGHIVVAMAAGRIRIDL